MQSTLYLQKELLQKILMVYLQKCFVIETAPWLSVKTWLFIWIQVACYQKGNKNIQECKYTSKCATLTKGKLEVYDENRDKKQLTKTHPNDTAEVTQYDVEIPNGRYYFS